MSVVDKARARYYQTGGYPLSILYINTKVVSTYLTHKRLNEQTHYSICNKSLIYVKN